MEGYVYFPTLIYRDEQPEFCKRLKPVCQKILEESENYNSGELLIQTRDVSKDQELDLFCSYLLKSAKDILKDQGYNIDVYDFYVSSLWFQEIRAGAGTDVHVHKHSQISGWLFLDTPENGSIPLYYDPRMNKEMIELNEVEPDLVTNATSIVNFSNVCPGTVLFNNSWLRHQMTQNMSPIPTRTLHFMISHDLRKDILCNTL